MLVQVDHKKKNAGIRDEIQCPMYLFQVSFLGKANWFKWVMFFPRWIQSLKLSYSSPCKMWVGRLLFIWGPVCIEGLCWFILFLPGRVYHDQSSYYHDSSPHHHHLSGFIKTNNNKCSIWKARHLSLAPCVFFWVGGWNSDSPVVLTLGGQETSFSRWCCSHLSRRQCPFADVDELILWIELLMIHMCGKKSYKVEANVFPVFFWFAMELHVLTIWKYIFVSVHLFLLFSPFLAASLTIPEKSHQSNTIVIFFRSVCNHLFQPQRN